MNAHLDLVQVGMVTDDLDRYLDRATAVGLGPFHVWTMRTPDRIRLSVRDNLQVRMSVRTALTRIGPIRLEVTQPLDGPSVQSGHLRRRGQGLHDLTLVPLTAPGRATRSWHESRPAATQTMLTQLPRRSRAVLRARGHRLRSHMAFHDCGPELDVFLRTTRLPGRLTLSGLTELAEPDQVWPVTSQAGSTLRSVTELRLVVPDAPTVIHRAAAVTGNLRWRHDTCWFDPTLDGSSGPYRVSMSSTRFPSLTLTLLRPETPDSPYLHILGTNGPGAAVLCLRPGGPADDLVELFRAFGAELLDDSYRGTGARERLLDARDLVGTYVVVFGR